MGITGAHVLLYTSEPDAVRAIFSDVFGWHHVDAGQGDHHDDRAARRAGRDALPAQAPDRDLN